MDKLLNLNIITQKYYDKINDKIFKNAFEKSTIQNIELNSIGLSRKQVKIFISEKELHIPIYSFLNRIIIKDIQLNYDNKVELINNYYFSFNLFLISNKKKMPILISKFHILKKIKYFNLDNCSLLFNFNDYGSCKNYDKSALTSVCPVTYNEIIFPGLCIKCENAFEDIPQIKCLQKCPMCRSKNFYKSISYSHDLITSTMDIYWYHYASNEKLLLILYKLNIINIKCYKQKSIIFNNTMNEFEDESKNEIFEEILYKLEIFQELGII